MPPFIIYYEWELFYSLAKWRKSEGFCASVNSICGLRKLKSFFFLLHSCWHSAFLFSFPLAGDSARTRLLRCGILSSAFTSGCRPIRSAAVIPPAFWGTSSPRATIMSTSSCFKGEWCTRGRDEEGGGIISSSWANRSEAPVMSGRVRQLLMLLLLQKRLPGLTSLKNVLKMLVNDFNFCSFVYICTQLLQWHIYKGLDTPCCNFCQCEHLRKMKLSQSSCRWHIPFPFKTMSSWDLRVLRWICFIFMFISDALSLPMIIKQKK